VALSHSLLQAFQDGDCCRTNELGLDQVLEAEATSLIDVELHLVASNLDPE
jgi:hypothetical protein